jgi:predicted transcriptional regulator
MEETMLKEADTTGFRETDMLRNNETAFSYMLDMQEVGVRSREMEVGVRSREVEAGVRSREMKAEIIDL